MKIVIVGNGVSGLILGICLASSGHAVSVLYKPQSTFENSPLILPELAAHFMNEVWPGITDELEESGAQACFHSEIISEKFKLRLINKTSRDPKLILTSRELLLKILAVKGAESGIEFKNIAVSGLHIVDGKVSGVRTGSSILSADFVFDCTGSHHARKEWVPGEEKILRKGSPENFYLRFYTSDSKAPLKLGTSGKARGGVYPVEGNKFALCFSIPETDISDIERVSEGLMDELELKELIAKSAPQSEWIKKTVANSFSDFYLHENLKNFYPIGDGVLFSNPVYGRGISLLALQLTPMLELLKKEKSFTHETISRQLAEGFRNSYTKWLEVSQDRTSWYLSPIRKFYSKKIESDPAAYELLLRFYQLEITPAELVLGIMRSSMGI